MILISGAAENFGKATIDCLLGKGARLGTISAFVRERTEGVGLLSKGIILRIGDFDNYASLVDAFDGVEKLLLVSGTNPGNCGKQHDNAIKAAKEAGIEHIFYIRYETNNETEDSPIAFQDRITGYNENLIRKSGIPYTIFYNDVYTSTLPVHLSEDVSETGVVFTAQEAPEVTFISHMAEATANLLLSEGHENKEYYFSDSEHVTAIASLIL
jgi:NAD(P)H dehydrogenase (quinone)